MRAIGVATVSLVILWSSSGIKCDRPPRLGVGTLFASRSSDAHVFLAPVVEEAFRIGDWLALIKFVFIVVAGRCKAGELCTSSQQNPGAVNQPRDQHVERN